MGNYRVITGNFYYGNYPHNYHDTYSATSKATRERDPSHVRRCAMHAARGDSARCARSWARAPLFAPSRSSIRRLRPLPLLTARARAAPHASGGVRRGTRSARGTAREVSGARATPAVRGARAADGGARRAERPLAFHARRCALSVHISAVVFFGGNYHPAR